MLRLLAGSVDEIGKLFAGLLQEGAQLGLLLCIALASAGYNHEEPRYFRRFPFSIRINLSIDDSS